MSAKHDIETDKTDSETPVKKRRTVGFAEDVPETRGTSPGVGGSDGCPPFPAAAAPPAPEAPQTESSNGVTHTVESKPAVEKEPEARYKRASDAGRTAHTQQPNPVYQQPHRLVARQHMGWNLRPNYRMLEMVGHGSYGEVMAAVDITSNRKVAIKRIVDVFRYEMDTRRFLRELHILRRVKHPNIIHLLDLFVHGTETDFQELYLVFEFMDTDLQKLLSSSQYLEDIHIQTFLHQILSGIRYLHSAHVMHRDIKPGNVLVNEDCSVRICDFGLSRGVPTDMCKYHKHDDADASGSVSTVVPEAGPTIATLTAEGSIPLVGSSPSVREAVMAPTAAGSASTARDTPPTKKPLRQMTRHVVTRWYRPPEIILTQGYNLAIDVWSVGCIFAELLGMQKPSDRLEANHRKPLFPGTTCFPLSADSVMTFSSMQDQLNVIFDVIGTPSGDDITALENDAAKKYLSKLPTKPPKPWTSLYPTASVLALDLLSRMIVFNPEKRIAATDALNHPYLAGVSKDFVSDKVIAPVSETINPDFAEGVSDPVELRKLMLSEISAFHVERQSLFEREQAVASASH